MRGYFALPREDFEGTLWEERRPRTKFEAWLDLVRMAQFSEEPQEIVVGMRTVACHYGELFASMRELALRWRWSKTNVVRYIKMLQDCGNIGTEPGRHMTRISISDYARYNASRYGDGPQSGTETERKRHGDGTPCSKKVKNVNNVQTPLSVSLSPQVQGFVLAGEEVGLSVPTAVQLFLQSRAGDHVLDQFGRQLSVAVQDHGAVPLNRALRELGGTLQGGHEPKAARNLCAYFAPILERAVGNYAKELRQRAEWEAQEQQDQGKQEQTEEQRTKTKARIDRIAQRLGARPTGEVDLSKRRMQLLRQLHLDGEKRQPGEEVA